jgi:hypothetical protein
MTREYITPRTIAEVVYNHETDELELNILPHGAEGIGALVTTNDLREMLWMLADANSDRVAGAL